MPDVPSSVIVDSQESASRVTDTTKSTPELPFAALLESRAPNKSQVISERKLVKKTAILNTPELNSYNFIICSQSTDSETPRDSAVEVSHYDCTDTNTKEQSLSQKSGADTDLHISVRRDLTDLVIGDSQSLSDVRAARVTPGLGSSGSQAKSSPALHHTSLLETHSVKVQSWLAEDHSGSMAEVTDSIQSCIPAPPNTSDVQVKRVSPVGPQNKEISKQILTHQAETRASIAALGSSFEASEYILPVRLNTLQRQIYASLLLDHADDIVSFCQNPQPDKRPAIEKLLRSLTSVTTHPLLVATSLPESQLSPHDEAWYLVQSSSKFELIAEVVESLRCEPLRIGIFCDDDKSMDLWYAVLDGLKVRNKRINPGSNVLDATPRSDELEVLIIPVGQELSPTANVDLTFSLGQAARLRHAPSIRLIANNSAEHVMEQVSDLVTVVSTVASLSDTVGICSAEPGDAPSRVVQFLCGGSLEAVLLQDIVSSSSQYDQVSYSASTEGERMMKDKQVKNKFAENAPHIIVTQIDGLEVHTEAPASVHHPARNVDGNFEDRDISAFRNGFTSQFADHNVEQIPIGNQADAQAQFISPVHLEKNPTQIYEEVKNEIWSKPSAEQERISNLEDDIERMMDRFDELRQECRELAQQRDQASEQAASFQKRFERVLEEARTARQEKNEMRMSLERLKMPPLPEESSPEYYRIENTRLRSELEKASKLSESKAQDFEFVRQQYQQSSSAAADLAGENAIQASEIAVLKNKIADGLGYKSAVLQTMSVQDALKEEAEKLSLRNNVLIEQLRRMRDEKMTSRGREGRRDIAMQERKRASSASAEVGQRKKVDKVGQSRLSVASLMSPTPNEAFPQAPTSISNSLQQMIRGQSHDSRAYTRDRTPKRVRTPF